MSRPKMQPFWMKLEMTADHFRSSDTQPYSRALKEERVPQRSWLRPRDVIALCGPFSRVSQWESFKGLLFLREVRRVEIEQAFYEDPFLDTRANFLFKPLDPKTWIEFLFSETYADVVLFHPRPVEKFIIKQGKSIVRKERKLLEKRIKK